MKLRLKICAVALVASGVVSSAHAAFIDAPVPVDTFITHNGFEWAWANPLPGPGNGFDLSFQGGLGWRIPSLAELALAPDATDFIFGGANVPLGGTDPASGAFFAATNADLTGDAACATPYFSTVFRHCDWQDGNGQPFEPWAGTPGAFGFADQLAIRTPEAQVVPEPGSVLLILAGLAGLAGTRRKAMR